MLVTSSHAGPFNNKMRAFEKTAIALPARYTALAAVIIVGTMGIVIAASRAMYRAGKAMAVLLHTLKPAQYLVVPTEPRADP
jgi:hypothetical protein